VIYLSLAIGIAVGWIFRSIQFGYDEDCANPNHKQDEE